MRPYTLFLLAIMNIGGLLAQSGIENPSPVKDSIPSNSIAFTPYTASNYISGLLKLNNLWRNPADTLRLSLSRLVDHFHEPFDSVQNRLSRFKYDSVTLKPKNFVRYDTIPIKWLNDSTLIVDTLALPREPFKVKMTAVRKKIDSTSTLKKDTIPAVESLVDFMQHKRDRIKPAQDSLLKPEDIGLQANLSVLQEMDSISEILIDTAFLQSNNISIHPLLNKRIPPAILQPANRKAARFLPDSSRIVISDTTTAIVADEDSPFYIVPNEVMTDSLRQAVETLLSFASERDSFLLYFNDIHGKKIPFWLSNREDDLNRFWVKNYKNDSITLWLGNPSRNILTLVLEDDVSVIRLEKESAGNIPLTLATPERKLAKVELLQEIPVYWDYDLASSFAMSQTYLSNWAKGGENSFSSVLDITGAAKYTNKQDKTQWANSGRLKYGTIITQENGMRTNTDLLEFNSQYNRVIRGKIDFTTSLYMKTQVAKGYKYPNDSVVISRFLNPGSFTIGVGMEYKPFKKTTINFSPLSYKNTFVLDTANIDQTRHGIAKDKMARQEMGSQLVVKSTNTLLDGLSMTNSVRLFSSYLNKPENIDVDWEITLNKQINWFFNVQLNMHFIYDDDIRFEVLDENEQPVLLPDGSKKKVPKLQFKQFLGLTMAFKF